jgi:hypothetical protein
MGLGILGEPRHTGDGLLNLKVLPGRGGEVGEVLDHLPLALHLEHLLV